MDKSTLPEPKINSQTNIRIEASFASSTVYPQRDFDLPERYVHIVEGTIFLRESAFTAEEKVVGAFTLKIILGDLVLKDGIASLFNVYDREQETCDFFEEILADGNGNVNMDAKKAMGGEKARISKNVLFVDRFGLLPEYRKIGLGELVLKDILCRYSLGAGMAVIQPVPFDFNQKVIKDGKVYWNEGEWEDSAIGSAKLAKYYKAIGFNNVEGSRFMIMKL